MRDYSYQNFLRATAAISLSFVITACAFAEEPAIDPMDTPAKLSRQEQKKLTELQKEARTDREKGLEMQRIGNLDSAMSWYQKAILLDPAYAEAHNDLGVFYEAAGLLDQAETYYLQSIKLDPDYLSAYTNLALLYENKRDLEKAAIYWQKRAELGAPDDPWTKKAKTRLADLKLVISKNPVEELKEKEVVSMVQEVSAKKSVLKKSDKDNKEQAVDIFAKAKSNFNKGNEVTALKLAVDASQLDPDNIEIQKFIDKVQTRLLSR